MGRCGEEMSNGQGSAFTYTTHLQTGLRESRSLSPPSPLIGLFPTPELLGCLPTLQTVYAPWPLWNSDRNLFLPNSLWPPLTCLLTNLCTSVREVTQGSKLSKWTYLKQGKRLTISRHLSEHSVGIYRINKWRIDWKNSVPVLKATVPPGGW